MKVRLIGGIREVDPKDPLMGLQLQAVAFPMTVPNYGAASLSDPEEVTLHDDDELRAWAEKAYDETGYEIFGLEVPGPGRQILDLISAKKTEYENASPSTPGGVGEKEAVLAALGTLETHARDAAEAAHSPG